MIYLDNAATSCYRPDTMAEAAAQAIRTVGNCSRGAYEAVLTSARAVYGTRALVSELFHGEGPEQAVFTANSTESLNMAIKGVLKAGDRVVATVLDHNSVLRSLYEMERRGAELVIVGCTDEKDRGCLDYGAMKAAIRPGTKAVVCTHASSLTGDLVSIRRIDGWCRKAGALFIVDASQTVGVFPIDMEQDMIDILCFIGHKGLMGPQGIGGICVRKGVGIRPLLFGGGGIMTYFRAHPDSMLMVLGAGTLNVHGLVGLRASLTYIREQGADEIREKEIALIQRFYDQAKTIPGVRICGDFRQEQRAAVVALNLGDEDSGEVSDYLAREHEVYTRSDGYYASLMHETLGTREQGAVRFSFPHFNREEEADMTCLAFRAY